MTTPYPPHAAIPARRSRHRVLLAGHRPVLRRAYAQVLLAHGFDVTSAADGAEALELLDAARPDVVLAEATMPVLDGISLVRAMRVQAVWIPVVVVAENEALRRCALRAGADGYLVAPFGPQALVASLGDPAARGRLLRDAPPRRRPARRRGVA